MLAGVSASPMIWKRFAQSPYFTDPSRLWEPSAQRLDLAREGLERAVRQIAESANNRLARNIASIEALNPLSVLSRGYAATFKEGKALTSAGEAKTGDHIRIRYTDGTVTAEVVSSEEGTI